MAYFEAPETQTVIANTLDRGVVSFSRVRALHALGYITTPVREDAIMLGFQHRDVQADLFLDNRKVAVRGPNYGAFTMYDYRREWACSINTGFEATNLYVPRAVLDAAFDDGRSGDLVIEAGVCVVDPVIAGLVMALGGVFGGSSRPTTLFLDHLGWALAAHCASNFLAARGPVTVPTGQLAPWQLRIAKDLMASRLDGDIRLSEIAAACGLSVKHFARAFQRSTASPPHRWLMQRRIERAESLLLSTTRPLAAIALECGFTDQSHFTTVFRRIVGVPPGAWRHIRRN
ncbi:AraC family transcriptional regulator [Polymorphobacter sp. PAMC 29334]|uniref:helix-turn-helix domain-containing protein n=1 Tax=Polymorphobacter sp. PAMC 29334 TaxID=2862331 RepID=UPI001C664790|nr:AraC family transcriptional regulator [Polymorphobacter sp. PAMC 29334]QYE34593.1 AraC family transcriptional regulator [Polymorphobacter sp. PAMC 29334]